MTTSTVRLADLAIAHYGKALKEADRETAGPHTVFGSSGPVGRHSEALVAFPTLIIGRKGSVGEVTWAPHGGWPIDTAYYLEVREPNRTDLRYLYWALKRAGLGRRAITTSIPGLNRDELYRTRILLPLLEKQRQIAVLLDKAHAIRRKRREGLVLLEDFLRSAFLEMFGDPVGNGKGWDRLPLRDVADVTTGNTPSRLKAEYYGDTMEWIKSDNINTPGHYLTTAEEWLSTEGRDLARSAGPGAILMTCIAGSRNCIGNVALSDREVAFNQQINAIEVRPPIDHRFLYAQFLFGKKLVQQASTDSMKGMVSKSRLEAVQVITPPAELQKRFGDWFTNWHSTHLTMNLAAKASDELFGSLSQLAFGGQI